MTSVTPTSESGSPTGSDVGTSGVLPTGEPDGKENSDVFGSAGTSAPASVSSRYEPKTRRGTSYANREYESQAVSSRNCLKWAESLQALLNDAEGLSLFQEFLQQEDAERFQMLEFWLACKGLSKQPPAQAHQLVRVIYAQLFLKAQLGIDERIRKSITQQIKDDTKNKKLLSPTIFAEACAVVERAMNEVMHPNFLTSDVYLNHVQQMQTADLCPVEACQSTAREAPALPDAADHVDVVQLSPINQQPLPVLHEDKELTLRSLSSDRRRSSSSGGSTRPSSSSSSPQRHPQLQPLPMDPFSTKFLRQFGSVSRWNANPSRRLYNYSYNPVSRQDSELQSLSSDARTDSMSDLSLDEKMCTKETYAYKRQLQRQLRSMRENANINKNPDLVASVIPRTSNPHARESAKPLPPQEFAKNLIFKLEKLKKERDAEEIVARKLNTVEDLPNEAGSANVVGALSHHDFTETDDSQEILDNHMARIWSDKTPRRSPSQAGTPIRPKSPDGRKVWPMHLPAKGAVVGAASVPIPIRLPHAYVINTAKKKDKDVCSLFSSDSGNGTDPTEGFVDHRYRGGGGGGSSSSGSAGAGASSLIKSKSMPEQDEPHTSEYLTGGAPGFFQRGASKVWSSSRRTLTDSGVSVISGSRGTETLNPQSPRCKEKLVSSWLLDSNRTVAACAGSICAAVNEEKDASTASFCAVKHKTRPNVIGHAAPPSLFRCKTGAAGNGSGGSGSGSGSGSGLPDRGNNGNGGCGNGSGGGSAFSTNVRNILPGQPFVADPSMPPFPFHSVDTDTQLEETRRRLNEMGSKLNRMPTTMTSSSLAASSRSCGENSCSGAAKYPTQPCFKTETNVTHRPTTLTRANRKSCGAEDSHFTTVVYNFNDEQMPYLSRIPGNPITLRHFKDYMPKKGRYRYYFVTPCEDLEMQPIQEEITDDCEFLPLWKGKVIAQIRAID